MDRANPDNNRPSLIQYLELEISQENNNHLSVKQIHNEILAVVT